MMGYIKDIIFELYSTYRDKRRIVTMLAFMMIFLFVICESAYRKSSMPYGNGLDDLSSYFYFYTMLWLSGIIYSNYMVKLFSKEASTWDKLSHIVRRKFGALVMQTMVLALAFVPFMIVWGYKINFILLTVMVNVCVLDVANIPIIVTRLCADIDPSRDKWKTLQIQATIILMCFYVLFCYLGDNYSVSVGIVWQLCALTLLGFLLYFLMERCLKRKISK